MKPSAHDVLSQYLKGKTLTIAGERHTLTGEIFPDRLRNEHFRATNARGETVGISTSQLGVEFLRDAAKTLEGTYWETASGVKARILPEAHEGENPFRMKEEYPDARVQELGICSLDIYEQR